MKYNIVFIDESDPAQKPIILLATDDEIEKSKWIVEIGSIKNRAPSGSRVAVEVVESDSRAFEKGHVFPSMSDANKALGFNYDRLSVAFSSAKIYGHATIRVRGVTLRKKVVVKA